tara:strand:+ start:663 stop:1043 length:381 start_codon:yes stop_codon:yes gene_type:complete
MARHQAVFDLRGPQMDADQVWNLLSPILATAVRASFTFTLAQTGNRLLLDRAMWYEVEGIVDGFVRDVVVSVIRKHTLQVRTICSGDQYLRSRKTTSSNSSPSRDSCTRVVDVEAATVFPYNGGLV